MKKFLNILRYFFLGLFAFIFILIFPLTNTYRITHSKLFQPDFWTNMVFSGDFTKLMLSGIPDERVEIIKQNPAYNRKKKELNDFVQEEIIEKKFKPFMKKTLDFMIKRRTSVPQPVSLKREKNQLYYRLIEFLNLQGINLDYSLKQAAEQRINAVISRSFPDALVMERILMPRIVNELESTRKRLAQIDKQAKFAFYIPIGLALLIIALALQFRKMLSWLGLSLIISFPLAIAYNLIIFYGFSPGIYLYEQLRAVPDLRAVFNDYVITAQNLQSFIKSELFMPIMIQSVIFLGAGILFTLLSVFLKNLQDKRADAKVEVVE